MFKVLLQAHYLYEFDIVMDIDGWDYEGKIPVWMQWIMNSTQLYPVSITYSLFIFRYWYRINKTKSITCYHHRYIDL